MRSSRWECRSTATKFAPRLAHDLNAARDAERGHDRGDDEVRPARAGAEDAEGRQEHRDVAERVVARANPDRAHVRVAAAEAVERERHAAVGQEREHADNALDLTPGSGGFANEPRHPGRAGWR